MLGRVEASGKYHLFMAKVGDTWKGYAELNGEIAIEAKRMDVDEGKKERDVSGVKPTIKFGSICFPVPYCWVWCI